MYSGPEERTASIFKVKCHKMETVGSSYTLNYTAIYPGRPAALRTLNLTMVDIFFTNIRRRTE